MGDIGRPKGLPKTGGRQKGTKNRQLDLHEALERLQFDPINEMVKGFPTFGPEDKVKVDLLIRLTEFLYPRRKPADPPPEPVANSVSILKPTQTEPPAFDPGAFLDALEANEKGRN